MSGGPATPPAALLLVHGAGSGPWVFAGWPPAFPGVAVSTVDLQRGLDAASAGMADYARAVVDAARELPRPLALCGWSMGGLVALQAAQAVRPDAVVLLEASPPGEVQGFAADVPPAAGTFDPEEVYGRFPPGVPARPESLRARAERKRGISVPALPCPSLVIYGRDYPDDRGRALAARYGSATLELPELRHFDLVLDPRVPEAVARYLGVAARSASSCASSAGMRSKSS